MLLQQQGEAVSCPLRARLTVEARFVGVDLGWETAPQGGRVTSDSVVGGTDGNGPGVTPDRASRRSRRIRTRFFFPP